MNNYKKEQINIDTVCKYSTDVIFNVLKKYIEYKEKIYDDDGVEVPLYHRLTVVCAFTEYLTNEKLLNHTLDFLKTHDLINDIENTGIDLSSYSEIDVTKIKAIYYSLTSLYKLNIKALKFPNSKNPKQLDIKLKENRIIEHNLQEVLNSIQMNNVYQFEESISKYPINTQKNEINKWIRSALKVGNSKETKMFDVEIDYLKDISDHLIEPETPQEYVNINNKVNAHPKFNPNLWNRECYELFKYLYDNYYKDTKRQLTNIWFYLKENDAKKYTFNATKDIYKDFIFKNYSIEITNQDKAVAKYEDKEYKKMHDHRIIFEDTLK